MTVTLSATSLPFAQMMGIAVPSVRLAGLIEARGREAGADLSQPEVVRNILREIEDGRLRLVRESVAHHDRIAYRAPTDALSATEIKAVQIFATVVKPLVDEIEATQQDPNFPVLDRYMAAHGDHDSRTLWRRFRRDTLAGPYAANQAGSLFPFFPDLPPINGMIDPRITLAEFQAFIGALSVHDDLLRPTTVFERTDGGEITGTPLPLHPRSQDRHRALAAALEEISTLQVDRPLDESLRDQLRKWARYCRTGAAADEAAAVQATIDAGEGGGLLRVHLGPSESYWPDNLLFPYEMGVGIRSLEYQEQLERQKRFFPALEALLSDILHYRPRTLSTRGGFADAVYEAVTGGFAETYHHREPLASNFPNHSYDGVVGSNRFLFLEVLEPAADQVKISLGRLIDDPDIRRWNEREASILMSLAHESGHLLGPLRDHVTPSGERMGLRFGRHWGSADEPKADLTIVPLVRLMKEAGEVSDDQAVGLLRALVGWSLSNRYKGKEAFFADTLTDHAYGHMMIAGYFFKKKVLTLRSPVLHVDYDLLQEEGEQLWREIIAFQAAGDLEGFLDFGRRMVTEIPGEADAMILAANQDLRPFFIERYLV